MKGEIAGDTDLIREGSHVIAEFDDKVNGPTLIVVGGIHGNEPSGVKALLNVTRRLEPMRGGLSGRVYFLAGNTRALRRKTRFIDSDLNRHWIPANLSMTDAGAVLAEDVELIELKRILDNVLAAAEDEVYVLDLHTTSAEGKPFATLGDTLRNRHFAQRFPITVLLGIEEQLQGTMLEYLNGRGAVTLGFEGGRHGSDEAAANHEALVWLALVNTGIVKKAPELDGHVRTLRSSTGAPSIVEVRYRKPVVPEEEFEMDPGYNNFDPIRKGQVLARNKYGPIRAREGGMVLMPLYQSLGEDGFFIGRKIAPFWIWLSEVLRRLHAAGVMPILPGVSRHPDDPESLIINTGVARFFPLQIFHLLGFRRRRWTANKLVVSRRRFDTNSPFVK